MAMCSGTILTATARRRRQIDGLAWAAAADRRLGVGSVCRSTAWRRRKWDDTYGLAWAVSADWSTDGGDKYGGRSTPAASAARLLGGGSNQRGGSPAATQSGENVIGRLGDGSSATTTRRLLDVGLGRFASVEDGNTVIGRCDWV
jgi:hypothetical protein